MRTALPIKEITYDNWVVINHPEYIIKWERVLFYDPTEMYAKIDHLIDPHKRHLTISIDHMFPKQEGICACGCDRKLEGRSTKWFSEDCSKFAWDIRNIICNAHQRPEFYIRKYFGDKCAHCNECDGEECDHVIGVKHGGSGGWLSNYQWVCKKCHRSKTNKDFGFKQK